MVPTDTSLKCPLQWDFEIRPAILIFFRKMFFTHMNELDHKNGERL